jgi:predicted lipid-binding transport protein (Tim44 family)
MGEQFFDIILFAMVAGFLILRLRSVLGRRTGNERPPPQDPFARRRIEQRPQADDKVVQLPDQTGRRASEGEPAVKGDPLSAALTQIQIADPSFRAPEFVKGANAAFELIVSAYAKGDAKALRPLLNDEVYSGFASAIAERDKAGLRLESTLVRVISSEVVDARVDGRVAFVTVKFVTEQVNVTRNAVGTVVDGSPEKSTVVTDIWTFARNTRATDPNWTLVETSTPH